jgi:hypothetical protein
MLLIVLFIFCKGFILYTVGPQGSKLASQLTELNIMSLSKNTLNATLKRMGCLDKKIVFHVMTIVMILVSASLVMS